MRIAILSRNRFLYSTRRLLKAARLRGHEVVVGNPLQAELGIHRPLAIHLPGVTDPLPDAVLPRIGQSISDYGLAVLRQLELLGVTAVNDHRAFSLVRDKAHTLQVLTAAGVAVPPTILTTNTSEIEAAIDAVGGLPVVVKMFKGTQGVGVMRIDSVASLRSILDTMRTVGQDVLVQRYVAEAGGRDLRAVVVGGRIVAAMRRRSSGDTEFRANLHRGGSSETARLSDADEAVVLRAVEATGLEVAGVDVLETREGPFVLEVNAAPGLEGIEEASGVDVADAIVEFAEHRVGHAAASSATS